MRPGVLALALFGGAALATGGLTADEKKVDEKKVTKALTKKEVAALMKQTHRGEKSAQVLVEAELKKDAPDWEQIARGAKAFTRMGEAFSGVDLGYSSPAKYVASAKALDKAAGEKDKKAADEALAGLKRSCSRCHSYAGPGGILK
jgi:hypothetical protein